VPQTRPLLRSDERDNLAGPAGGNRSSGPGNLDFHPDRPRRPHEGAIEAAFSWPLRFALDQNIPNPFNPATTICFALPEPGHAVLAVYGLDGQLVRTLVNHTLTAGEHRIVWDGKDTLGREAASGTYIAHLHTGQGALTRRMTLLR